VSTRASSKKTTTPSISSCWPRASSLKKRGKERKKRKRNERKTGKPRNASTSVRSKFVASYADSAPTAHASEREERKEKEKGKKEKRGADIDGKSFHRKNRRSPLSSPAWRFPQCAEKKKGKKKKGEKERDTRDLLKRAVRSTTVPLEIPFDSGEEGGKKKRKAPKKRRRLPLQEPPVLPCLFS